MSALKNLLGKLVLYNQHRNYLFILNFYLRLNSKTNGIKL